MRTKTWASRSVGSRRIAGQLLVRRPHAVPLVDRRLRFRPIAAGAVRASGKVRTQGATATPRDRKRAQQTIPTAAAAERAAHDPARPEILSKPVATADAPPTPVTHDCHDSPTTDIPQAETNAHTSQGIRKEKKSRKDKKRKKKHEETKNSEKRGEQ